MKEGRPTTYNAPELAKKIVAYIKERQQKNFLPTVEGLAVYLNVARSTIYLWAKEHDEFSDILEHVLSLQADQLIQNSLVGHFNATISKLLLTKHDYRDKVDTDVTSKGQRVFTSVRELSDGELENILATGEAGTSEEGTGEKAV